MPEHPLRNVRVLIVEDEPLQLKGLNYDLDTIDEDERRMLGIAAFQSSLAGSVEEATHRLAAADSPFDILILDLGLPRREGEKPFSGHGQRFLKHLDKRAVKEVIIVSSYHDYENVVKAVRRGAVDFIAKPYRTELLQRRVMESWRRVLEKDAADVFEERIKGLVLHAENGFAHLFNSQFLTLVRLLTESANNLEEHIRERFGLIREEHSLNDLIRQIEKQHEALGRARKEWRDLLPAPHPLESRSVAIEGLLAGVRRTVQPCLLTRGVELTCPPASGIHVLTLRDDVYAVLKEIVVGALCELPDGQLLDSHKNVNHIAIHVGTSGGCAEVSFQDDLPAILPDAARGINEGRRVDHYFKRGWGLAIMQHTALYGGGWLRVESQGELHNVITYRIPLADS